MAHIPLMDSSGTQAEMLDRFQDPYWGASQLAGIPLFSAFSEDELRGLYSMGRLLKMRPSSHVVIEGEPTRGLFLLLHGTVSVHKSDPSTGSMMRIAVLEEGAHFGEFSLFDTAPRSATVAADTQCILFSLDAKRFDDYLHKRGAETEAKFYRSVCAELSVRVRKLNDDYITAQQLLWKHALRRSEEGQGGKSAESRA